MILIYITIAWFIGIITASYTGAGAWLILPAILGGLVVCLQRLPGKLRLFCALLCAASLGGLRYHLAQPNVDANWLAYYNDTGEYAVSGYISAEPRSSSSGTQLQVQAEELLSGTLRRPINGRLVVTASKFRHFSYGQRVLITGTLEYPPIYEDFNYREYLAAKGVSSVMRKAQVEILPGYAGSKVTRWLLNINHKLRSIIDAILPQPEAGLLQGVLLGVDDALPVDSADAFRTTGVTHILVVSGFNISILMQLILVTANKAVRRQVALVLALAGITLFGLLVGFSAPVMRAWLMGALALIAVLTGRKAHPFTSLAAASLIMTAVNPLDLQSVSFQLSFAATLALLCVEPVLARLLNPLIHGKLWESLTELATTTVAAQLITLPIIWHYFGQISLVAIIANLLILPLQPAILAAGAMVTFIGACWLPAGQTAAYLVWPLLRYTILVPRWLSQLPSASLQVVRITSAGMLVFYLVISGLLYLLSRLPFPAQAREKRLNLKPWVLPGILALVAVALWSYIATMPDGRTHIAVLDIGQGDAILITTGGGRHILIDGGMDSLTLRERLGETLPLNQHQLDMIVATHGDADHIGGLVELPAYFQIDYAIHPPDLGDSEVAKAWYETCAAAGVPLQTMYQGFAIHLGDDIILQVLNPEANAPDANANSLVLRLSQGRFSMLLTSDIDSTTEYKLVDEDCDLSAYLIKVAHHGSDSSSSELFLSKVDPEMAVISVGKDNTFGLPDESALERIAASGCQIWRTDQHGTIEFVTDGQTVGVSTTR